MKRDGRADCDRNSRVRLLASFAVSCACPAACPGGALWLGGRVFDDLKVNEALRHPDGLRLPGGRFDLAVVPKIQVVTSRLRKETQRIQRAIDEEFDVIEPEDRL